MIVDGYRVIVAATATGFSAHIPELPGCVATGKDTAEVTWRIKKAIAMHIESPGPQAAQTPKGLK